MKKIISFVLAIAMIMSMNMAVFATAGEEKEAVEITGNMDVDNGSIVINNIGMKEVNEKPVPVATYKIYQMLKLESFNFSTGSYTYSFNDDWKEFFIEGVGKDYIVLDADKGNIPVWIGATDAGRIEEFAKLALEYAKTKGISPTKSTENVEDYRVVENSNSIEFGVEGKLSKNDEGKVIVNGKDGKVYGANCILQLGYYLVDSTVGSLCGLSTTNPTGIINSKNAAPTIDKQVQEDLTGQWGKVNSADIGQIVNFRTTIHVHDGAQNYTVHDYMEDSLTFDSTYLDTIEVYLIKGTSGNHGADDKGTKIEKTEQKQVGDELVTVTNYTTRVTNNACTHPCENDGEENHGCRFEVAFSEDFCNGLDTNDRLIVYYSAMLNRYAEIGNGTAEDPANENKTYLSYGEGHVTTESSTVTKTYPSFWSVSTISSAASTEGE